MSHNTSSCGENVTMGRALAKFINFCGQRVEADRHSVVESAVIQMESYIIHRKDRDNAKPQLKIR